MLKRVPDIDLLAWREPQFGLIAEYWYNGQATAIVYVNWSIVNNIVLILQ